jgi:hypothetical protein
MAEILEKRIAMPRILGIVGASAISVLILEEGLGSVEESD